jgi:hypothetical protein
MPKWSNTVNKSGFTDDVISFVTMGEKMGSTTIRDAVRNVEDPEMKVEMIRNSLVLVLSPIMSVMPPFIQQIVGRAFMEYVDWKAVVSRIETNPEDN